MEASWLWLVGFIGPQHVESSQTRDQTRVPCTGSGLSTTGPSGEPKNVHVYKREVLLLHTRRSPAHGAVIWEVQPQTEGCREPPETEGARSGFSPRTLGRGGVLPTPWCQSSDTDSGLPPCRIGRERISVF